MAAARICAIDGAIACMEGSHLIDLATGATVAHHPLADAATARWRAAVDAHDLAGFVLDADGIHHDHRGAAYAGYVATWSPNLRVVDADAARTLAALATVAIGDRDAVAAAHAALTSAAEPPYAVQFAVGAHPGKHAVLTRAAGPTKGTALAALCEAAGCTVADIVQSTGFALVIPEKVEETRAPSAEELRLRLPGHFEHLVSLPRGASSHSRIALLPVASPQAAAPSPEKKSPLPGKNSSKNPKRGHVKIVLED